MLALLLSLVACLPTDGACTEEAVASVVVTTVDSDGEPITPDSVTYRVGTGELQQAECADADCTRWVAGYEQTGEFEIIANIDETIDEWCWAEGHAETTVTVEMDEDGCHPDTEEVTLVIDRQEVCE